MDLIIGYILIKNIDDKKYEKQTKKHIQNQPKHIQKNVICSKCGQNIYWCLCNQLSLF